MWKPPDKIILVSAKNFLVTHVPILGMVPGSPLLMRRNTIADRAKGGIEWRAPAKRWKAIWMRSIQRVEENYYWTSAEWTEYKNTKTGVNVRNSPIFKNVKSAFYKLLATTFTLCSKAQTTDRQDSSNFLICQWLGNWSWKSWRTKVSYTR